MIATTSESFLSTADTEPFDFYERLRGQGDVVWDAEMKAWLVVSEAAVRQIFMDDALFIHPFATMQAGSAYSKIRSNNPRSFFFLQGEKHHEIHRWWVRDLLSPKWIARYTETLIQPVIKGLLDDLNRITTFDLEAEFLSPLPINIFVRLLEMPRTDKSYVSRLKKLNDCLAAFANQASALRLEGESSEESRAISDRAIAAAEELDSILLPIVRERKGSAGEDIISRLWAGGPAIFSDWNEIDTLESCRRLLFAGSDSSVRAMANAFYMLLSNPQLLLTVREGGRATVGKFVEEALRLEGSAHFRPRRVMADTELAGVSIKKGEMVIAIMMAANRDPKAFKCPHQVDLNRPQLRKHLAFITGHRTCPGASLARAEMVEAIESVWKHYPHMRTAEDTKPPFIGFTLRSYTPLRVLVTTPDK